MSASQILPLAAPQPTGPPFHWTQTAGADPNHPPFLYMGKVQSVTDSEIAHGDAWNAAPMVRMGSDFLCLLKSSLPMALADKGFQGHKPLGEVGGVLWPRPGASNRSWL